ncbi:MAG TPA: bifunctional UDP-N-acetylglucosamine diphosphorylase/glucosamine-1-phosphate N-acetyltransferase GlmU [Casimicrobiaceae bacterium]|nr:bifunctional UDP-N-acetylglucosamine diphosphorylase/glucosamine-1-phosphate N-acetyltransferase GlmU [Casimicrobiaceae bacterium]
MPNSPLQFVILAAGQGKRMRSAQAKMLHSLAGIPLVAHVIEAAREARPLSIAMVVGHGGDAVEKALAAPDLVFVRQDPPRGTGDAVRCALAVLPHDGVTVVANGDCPLIPAATFAALADVAAHGRLALLTARVADPHGLGRVLRAADGSVRTIVEERDASAAERAIHEIYTGALAAPSALLAAWVAKLTAHNAQGEFYLTDVVAMALADGVPVHAELADDADVARGVNDRAQLADAERIVQRRRANALMLGGTTLADPGRIDVRGTLTAASDTFIDVGCVFEGEVTLAEGAEVGPYCLLRDTRVGPGARIHAFSHLEGAVVGAHARVGPYARLRPGAALAEDVHIGNFVEVKAATMGARSKANHLAYIGDATVGADVNFGAGSITANYDGANKHRTLIGDGVHIGSNCVLVAPIDIGAGATIGGGSTITQAAPAGELTLARARQVSVAGWQRPRKAKPS